MSNLKDFKSDADLRNVYRSKGLREAVQTDTDTYQNERPRGGGSGAHGT